MVTTPARAYEISQEEYQQVESSLRVTSVGYNFVYEEGRLAIKELSSRQRITEFVDDGYFSEDFVVCDTDANGAPEIYMRVSHLLGTLYWAFDLSELEGVGPSQSWKNLSQIKIPYSVNIGPDEGCQEEVGSNYLELNVDNPNFALWDVWSLGSNEIVSGNENGAEVRRNRHYRPLRTSDSELMELSVYLSCAWQDQSQDIYRQQQIRSLLWMIRNQAE